MWLLPVLSGVSSAAVRIFYRCDFEGAELPATGPLVVFANHPNSLLDPALVAAAAGRPIRFLAKSNLFTNRRVGWLVRAAGAIPVHRRRDDHQAAERNVEMFEAVFEELARGAAVGIFPEGISHSAPSLAKLKTGTARIALGAAARQGRPFPLVPVGLVLRDKGVFRSEALVIRGESVEWPDLAARGEADQDAVRDLTQRLDQALRAVTVNLERWEDQPLVDVAQAIWSAEMGESEREIGEVERAQTAAKVLADLRRSDDPEWKTLAREVTAHRRRLRILGLKPSDLDAKVDVLTSVGWTARRLYLLGPPAVLLAVAGAVVFWLPYRLTGRVVAAARPDADQQSTYKVLMGAAVYLLWILALATAVGVLWGGWSGVVALLLLPTLGLLGQGVRERWRGAWGDVRRFFLLRSRRRLCDTLTRQQRELAVRLHDTYERWRQGQQKP